MFERSRQDKSRQRKARRSRLAAGSVLVALIAGVIAACGDDEGGEAGERAESANIGVLMPLTGPFSSFGGDWQLAAEMAINEANQANLDMEFNPVVGDDPDPETGVASVRRMIDQQDVGIVVGGDSTTMLAVEPVVARGQTPIISSYAGSAQIDELEEVGNWLFRTVSSDRDQALVALRFFVEQEDLPSLGMFVENEAQTRSIAETIQQAYESAGGEVSASVVVNPDQPSYRAEISDVLGGQPEWVLCMCSIQSGVAIIQGLERANYDGGLFVPAELSTDEIIEDIGADVMEGTHAYTLGADPEDPITRRFLSGFEEEHGHVPVPYSTSAYDTAAIAVLAAFAAGSNDGPEIRDQIRAVANPPGTRVDNLVDGLEALSDGDEINYDGSSGSVDIEEGGSALTSFAILRADDGQWVEAEYYSPEDLAETRELTE